MDIRRWHWGKIVMLWAWGGTASALLLTRFVLVEVQDAPLVSLLALGGFLAILLALSVVTWQWLGGKESKEKAR